MADYNSSYTGPQIDSAVGQVIGDAVIKNTAQILTDAQKTQARSNIGTADASIYKADGVDIGINAGTNDSTRSFIIRSLDYFKSIGQTSGSLGINAIEMGDATGQFQIGSVSQPSNNQKGRYPWLASRIENGLLKAKTTALGSVVIGSCQCTGPCDFAFGGLNVNEGSMYSFISGTNNYIDSSKSTTNLFGTSLLSPSSYSTVLGRANNPVDGDYLEIGNGSMSGTTINRNNAFRVTSTGHAIAQNALGIEDGNGNVVEITAAQLQALINLIT